MPAAWGIFVFLLLLPNPRELGRSSKNTKIPYLQLRCEKLDAMGTAPSKNLAPCHQVLIGWTAHDPIGLRIFGVHISNILLFVFSGLFI